MAVLLTPQALGVEVRARRKAKSLSQTQLAELCGVSLRLVSELERGRESVAFGRVLLICNRLGLDLAVSARELS
jgi:HTH-type transcriptional regulator/antitoxin HipB